MSVVKPRRLVHRGTVPASGVVIDVSLVGEACARARAIAVWSPGVTVRRAEQWLIVLLPTPQLADAGVLPGAPLVKVGKHLLAAPLLPDEVASIEGPSDAIIVVLHGEAIPLDPQRLAVEDPAAWLEVGDVEVVPVESLGSPPAAIANQAPRETTTRALLGVAPASPEHEDLLQTLRGRDGGAPGDARIRTSLIAGLAASLVRLLARFFPRSSRSPATADGTAPLARASLAQRMSAWLSNVVARLLVHARLAQLIGERHAEHLRRVLEMMDRGDYEEALRHAIPIGGPVAEEGAHVALRVAKARESLAIRPAATRARAIVPFSGDVQSHLRQAYRRAFERLAALGRKEEAAFVLAELLHDNEEAVSFLENAGLKRLAAELAEARKLAPGLVVRQWFVAGDVARAVQIARRTQAFADAITRLERRSKEDAHALRIAWAESVAAAGDFANAHDIAWPVEAARPLARTWIDLAIEAGGVGAAKALVRKLVIEPEAFESLLPIIDELLTRPEPTSALGHAVLTVSTPTPPVVRALARRTARAALRLAIGTYTRRHLVPRLVERSGDSTLRADLPGRLDSCAAKLSERTTPLVHPIAPGAPGGSRLHDAVRLPNGRTLVALGEAGAKLLSPEGRVLFHADEPSHAIVVSDTGDRAIALAPRGLAVRIARLDLLRRRAKHWLDAPLACWAETFDGADWFAVQGTTVMAVDVQSDGSFATSFRLDVESPVARVARSSNSLAVQVAEGDVWRFDLPSLTLRSRAVAHLGGAPPLVATDDWIIRLSEGGAALVLDCDHQHERARIEIQGGWASGRIYAGTLTLLAISGVIVHVDLTSGEANVVRVG